MGIQFKNISNQAGFGMIETILAATLGLMLVFFLSSGVSNMKKASRNVDTELDLAGIRKNLIESIDCNATFSGRAMGNPCPTAAYIPLLGASGKVLTDALGTRSGKWVVRAHCSSSPSSGGLDVRALGILAPYDGNSSAKNWISGGKPDPSYYRKDELNSSPYDWNHPRSRLFIPSGLNALCPRWFGGGGTTTAPTVADCPPGQYIKSINFATNTVKCDTLTPPTPPCRRITVIAPSNCTRNGCVSQTATACAPPWP